MNRTKRIEIRLSDDEYQQLLERKSKPRLAEWLRDIALNEPLHIKKKADPKLLMALARIGGNINQIARACNTKQLDKYESVNILLELQNIRNQLNEILNHDS